jgi:transposase InsO family protein
MSGRTTSSKARTHDGRKFRILTIIDEASRECLALVVARQLRHEDVLAALAELFIERGPPAHYQVGQRPMSGSSGGFWPADIDAPTTIGAACNLSQMAPTVNGIAPCHSKRRIQRRRGDRGPHHP